VGSLLCGFPQFCPREVGSSFLIYFYFASCCLYLDKVIEERAILNRKWQGNIRYQYETNAL